MLDLKRNFSINEEVESIVGSFLSSINELDEQKIQSLWNEVEDQHKKVHKLFDKLEKKKKRRLE